MSQTSEDESGFLLRLEERNERIPPEMTIEEWRSYLRNLSLLLLDILNEQAAFYSLSREAVTRLLEKRYKVLLPFPVISDHQASVLLAVVDEVTKAKSARDPGDSELILRSGRHLSEHLAEVLLNHHLACLDLALEDGETHLSGFLSRLNGTVPHSIDMVPDRLMQRIKTYRSTGSFLHPPELSLSVAKIRTRAGARARRGNLWPKERKEKTLFLETLADQEKVSPCFTEEELVFLVSQSSMKMLRRKVKLLESEEEPITPNRLKANLSRLTAHVDRSKRQKTDLECRKDLLQQLGASPEQMEYISARASYQTMQNLVKLSNGELAISDLMGGRRAINKILRRQGRIPSEAEMALARYLVESERISVDVAHAYAHSRKNHSLEHLSKTLNFLKEQYRK
ncbi:MAG: hypothetical protein ABIH23_01575, partial [bacterium]